MKSRKETSNSRLQPWLFTFVHRESLQRFKILCFGRDSVSAEAHFRALPCSDFFDVENCMMLSNDKLVFFASMSNLTDIAPWLAQL